MRDETKLLCNKCYQPVETVVYPEGVYVEPCVCILDKVVGEWEKICDIEGKERYGQGYNDGYEVATSDNMEELEKDDEGYEDRIGA